MTEPKQITDKELANMIYDTARAKAILANQNALAHNEVLKRTPAYKSEIKRLGNPFILSLIKAERTEFAKVEKAESDLENFKGVIDEAFSRSERIISMLAKCAFVDYDDCETVLKALAKDRSSILGIAKKINRNE